jgi:hypothetical protein
MTCWQIVGLFAGALSLVSLALGVPCSPLHVSAWWPALTAFVGARVRTQPR